MAMIVIMLNVYKNCFAGGISFEICTLFGNRGIALGSGS